jgi:hypothetical protein
MKAMKPSITLCLAVVLGFALTSACGSDKNDEAAGGSGGAAGAGGSPDNTGSSCKTADDCYPGVDPTALSGTAQCLNEAEGGYCTHLCATDDDCCKAAGECTTSLTEVCSPFQSTNQMLCFLSCEPADIQSPDGGPAPASDWEYCQRYASSDFICRSSGGGSNNRKICVPGACGAGAGCSVDSDCGTGLVCVTGFNGGYCTVRDCTVNADCPTGSDCVTSGGKNFCFPICGSDDACSFCRPWDLRATCRSDVTFAESGTTDSVCVPPS